MLVPTLTDVREEWTRRQRPKLDALKMPAEGSLLRFVQEAWPIIEPRHRFVDNWHIGAICEHLEAVSRGQITNLLINVPPGCAKSSLVSVMWPAWEWARRPELRYLCASYGIELATANNMKCRDIVQSTWYQERWPKVTLRADQTKKTRYETTAGGFRIGSSIKGIGTGEHPDRNIIDDPHKTRESESTAERLAVINWFDGTMSTRGLARNAATVIVMQRLHEMDLSGHVLARENASDWTKICLPMRAERNRMRKTVIGFMDRRKEGALLWPSLFNESVVRTLEINLGTRKAAGQLQQRPARIEGSILKRPLWQYYDPDRPPRACQMVVISIDPALKAKTASNFSVAQVWAGIKANAYLLKAERGRFEYGELKRKVKDLYRWASELYPQAAVLVLVENTAMGPELIADLRDEIPGVIPVTAIKDKVERAIAATPALEAGNIFLPGFASPDGAGCDTGRTPPWVQDFIEECALFPDGESDDQVDAFTQALQRLKPGKSGISMMEILKAGDDYTMGDERPHF